MCTWGSEPISDRTFNAVLGPEFPRSGEEEALYPSKTAKVPFSGSLISCFQGHGEGQSICLTLAVSPVPLIQNNVTGAYFGVTNSEPLQFQLP